MHTVLAFAALSFAFLFGFLAVRLRDKNLRGMASVSWVAAILCSLAWVAVLLQGR